MLRRLFGPGKEEVTEERGNYIMKICAHYRVLKSREITWEESVTVVEKIRNISTCNILVGNPQRKISLERFWLD